MAELESNYKSRLKSGLVSAIMNGKISGFSGNSLETKL